MTPVCSPQLRERAGLRSPADLPPALLLQEETRRYWSEWLTAAGVADRIAPEGPTLGLHLTIPAAEAGQGFALADDVIAGDALVGGRLVKPFPIYDRHLRVLFRARRRAQGLAPDGIVPCLACPRDTRDVDRRGEGDRDHRADGEAPSEELTHQAKRRIGPRVLPEKLGTGFR